MKNTKEKILNFSEKIISFLEKERLNFVAIFLWIVFLGGIRTLTEAKFFGYAYGKIDYYFIFTDAHIVSFYICVFLGGVLILKFLTREKIKKIANLTSWGFIMVLVPPVIDHFIFHHKTYTYVPREKFIDFILFSYHKIFPDVAGYGLFLEIFLIMIFTTIYVYIKTRSIPKTAINFGVFNFFIAFISTPTLNPILNKWEMGDLCQPAFFLRYIVLSLLIFILIMLASRKELLPSFIVSSGPLRSLHFLMMGSVGIFVADHIETNIHELTSYTSSGNIGVIGITLLLILFIWQYAAMINNVYDIEIDRVTRKKRVLVKGFLNPTQLKEISVIFAVSAIGLAVTLGIVQVILTLLFLFLATVYSIPPLRLRNSPFSTTIIGLGSAIAFFIGYFTPSYTSLDVEVMRSYPSLTTPAMVIGWIIFVSLSAGSMVKDIDDYEGDKKRGVKNIFTLYGIRKGINISSIMLSVAFLSPLFLFYHLLDILVFIPATTAAIISFRKVKKAWSVFPFYFTVLFYALMRWFSIINP